LVQLPTYFHRSPTFLMSFFFFFFLIVLSSFSCSLGFYRFNGLNPIGKGRIYFPGLPPYVLLVQVSHLPLLTKLSFLFWSFSKAPLFSQFTRPVLVFQFFALEIFALGNNAHGHSTLFVWESLSPSPTFSPSWFPFPSVQLPFKVLDSICATPNSTSLLN